MKFMKKTPGNRKDKVASSIKRLISDFLLKNDFINDESHIIGSSIIITDVVVTPCLQHAKIFFSTLDSENIQLYQDVLEKNKFEIKNEIAKNLRLKYIPEIRFINDNSSEYAQKIYEIIKNH